MFQPGDHLKFRGAFGFPSLYHHGVYIGDNQVVHFYANNAKSKFDATIQLVPLNEFIKLAGNYPVEKEPHAPVYTVDAVRKRCLSQLGRRDYDVLLNNCEHFASWAVTGKSRSKQVEALFRK